MAKSLSNDLTFSLRGSALEKKGDAVFFYAARQFQACPREMGLLLTDWQVVL